MSNEVDSKETSIAQSRAGWWRRRRFRIPVAIVVVAVLVVGGFLAWTRHGAGPGSPRIGLSVSDDWYDDLGFHRAAYDVALARAGARVVSLRPSEYGSDVDRALAGLDGVVLAGGGDVHPSLFGSDEPGGFLTDLERDHFEIEVIRAARRRGIPVLGICRGCQILAVAYGGTLRDLRREPATAERHGIGLDSLAAHDVKIEPGTRLAGLIDGGPHTVNSFHAQAVASPGDLVVAARADDGVVEAVELPGAELVLGIQWHPEIQGVLDDTQHAIIEAFVKAAGE